MSLEGLLKELDRKKAEEQEKRLQSIREQYERALQEKEQEISSLREEIDTLRSWLDHSALPAFNPISQRRDSMGLIKMNFNPDKPCPEMWNPGEKDLLESVPRDREPGPSWTDGSRSDGFSSQPKSGRPDQVVGGRAGQEASRERPPVQVHEGHIREGPEIEVHEPSEGPEEPVPKPARKRPASRGHGTRPSPPRQGSLKKSHPRKRPDKKTRASGSKKRA